jgi:hypothetical protein
LKGVSRKRNKFQLLVFVNDKPVDLLPGMTVRHALIKAGLEQELAAGRKVYDAWGNELGLGGALSEGSSIRVR